LRRFARNGLSVSTIADQFWCEKRVELSFSYPLPMTVEMTIGKARHDELHREIAELIPVQAASIADAVGVRFHNMLTGLTHLVHKRQAREVPVIGMSPYLPVPIFGQIDELLVRERQTKIIDHKTRKSNKMPSVAQTRVSEFQLMTYYMLLKQFRSRTTDLDEVLRFYGLKENSMFSDELLKQLGPHGGPVQTNIVRLAEMAVRSATAIPEPSTELEIVYETQDTQRLIGSHRFEFSKDDWKEDLDFAAQYWLGKRPAKPVGEKNRWKCDYCPFKKQSICSVWSGCGEY